jgi:hypothetical protein
LLVTTALKVQRDLKVLPVTTGQQEQRDHKAHKAIWDHKVLRVLLVTTALKVPQDRRVIQGRKVLLVCRGPSG